MESIIIEQISVEATTRIPERLFNHRNMNGRRQRGYYSSKLFFSYTTKAICTHTIRESGIFRDADQVSKGIRQEITEDSLLCDESA